LTSSIIFCTKKPVKFDFKYKLEIYVMKIPVTTSLKVVPSLGFPLEAIVDLTCVGQKHPCSVGIRDPKS